MHARPPSAARPPTSGVPRGMRPPSRTRNGTEISAPSRGIPVNVRPMSKQGLPSAHTQSGSRQVADKSFFIGILRSKINDVVKEIERLEEEIETRKKGQSIQVNLSHEVEELRKEIIEDEAELTDYNVLSDRIANGATADDLITRFNSLEKSNSLSEEDVNRSFKEKRSLEENVNNLEAKFNRIMNGKNDDKGNDDIDPELRSLAKQIESFEIKVDELKKKDSTPKYDTSNKSREELLQMVKDITKEIGEYETEIKSEQKKLNFTQNQIKSIEDREGDLQSERGQKYLKLLRREQDMNKFLSTFEDTLANTKTELADCQRRVFECLVSTSQDIDSVNEMPSIDNFKQMQTDLAYKEKQMQDAQSTMTQLQIEVENRRRELEDLKNVDYKITDEIEDIKKKMAEMEAELPTFSDVESIRREGETRKAMKLQIRDNLKNQLHNLRKVTNNYASKYNEDRAKIQTNEFQVKIHTIEKDIKVKASENHNTAESIEENRRRTNYAIVKRAAMNIVAEINSLL